MPRKMCHCVKVRNYHVDSYGHVNNAQYLHYLEDARTDFFEELGYTLPELGRRDIFIFITESHLEYQKPARMGDSLLVYGWFKHLSSRKAVWQHEVYNAGNKELVLTGSITGLFLHHDKIISIPKDIRTAMNEIYFPQDR